MQSLWKTVQGFLKKLKRDLFYNPVIALLGIFPKNIKTLIQKDICISMSIEALFATANLWKQPKCPSIDGWINKSGPSIYLDTHTHTHTHTHTERERMEYYGMEWNIIQP